MTHEHSKRIQVIVDEDLAELIPGFLENRRKDVSKLLLALENGDYETVRELGHGMKGVGGGYGFDAITDMGAALEKAAKSQNGDRSRALTDQLSSYLERIDIVYE